MDIKNIEKLVVYNNENNKPCKLYIYNKDGSLDIQKYGPKSEEIALEFLKSNDMTLDEAINKGLVSVYFENFEDVDSYSNNNISASEEQEEIEQDDEEISEEELEDVDKDGLSFKEVAGISAAVLGVSVPVALGIAACNKQQNNKYLEEENTNSLSVDFDKASFSELMDEFDKKNQRRVFSENVYDVTEKLNNLCLDKSVFALDEDKDAVLQFSTDEIIAAKLVMNNYELKDLKEIFGTKELNAKKILRNYESFATKMMYYAMNAKAPSGVSTLIESESNRRFFEDIENAIIKFNKKINNTNADDVIRTFAYYFSHGIDGVNGISEDLESVAGVGNLCLNMISGYYDANVDGEYSKYLVVSSNPTKSDSEYRAVRMAQLQKGEKLKTYRDLEEKGNCTIDDIKEHLKSMIDKHNALIISTAANLVDEGKAEAAEKVLSAEENVPTFDQVKNAMDKELGPFVEIKDDVLYANRLRGVVKDDTISGKVVTASEFRNMSGQERREFIKKNGTVIKQTINTTETPVDYNDLTPSEQAEVDKQKETIPAQEAGDTAQATKDGWVSSTTYAETPGAYKYHVIYNRINPDAVSVVPTNNTLSDIAQAAYAFENVTITSSDPQIQAELAKDIASYNNTHSDPKMRDAYRKAWLQGIQQKLDSAVAQGKITRREAERLYQEALNAIKEKERQATTQATTVREEPTTAKPPKDDKTTQESTTKENTTQPTTKETTTKEPTTKKDETPVASEEKTSNEVDPNLSTDIPDSDFIIVDENYNSENTKYTASLTLDDIEEYVNSNSDKTLRR